MKRTDSGLFIASSFNILRFRARRRTVTLPSGERALITIDDSGTVKQVEHGEHLDGFVRPAPIAVKARIITARPTSGGFARPRAIRTAANIRRNRDQS